MTSSGDCDMPSVSGGGRASGEKSQHPLQVTVGLLEISVSTEDSSSITGQTTREPIGKVFTMGLDGSCKELPNSASNKLALSFSL